MKLQTKILIVVIIIVLASCKSIQYVPVETVKTEFRDREKIVNDTIIKHDSIHVRDTGDTVFVDRFSNVYKYRDRFIRDSIFVHDSIQVPYPVETIKEVNKLTKWQSWQIMSFRIILLIAIAYFLFKFFKSGSPIALVIKGFFKTILKL